MHDSKEIRAAKVMLADCQCTACTDQTVDIRECAAHKALCAAVEADEDRLIERLTRRKGV